MRNERGFALLLALFMLLIISGMILTWFSLIQTDLALGRTHRDRVQAVYFADGGSELGFDRARRQPDWSKLDGVTTSYTTPIPVTVTYTQVGTDLLITSTATQGRTTRIVELVVRQTTCRNIKTGAELPRPACVHSHHTESEHDDAEHDGDEGLARKHHTVEVAVVTWRES